jgi:hypothetical protein
MGRNTLQTTHVDFNVLAVFLETPAKVMFFDPLPERLPHRLADVKKHVGAVDRVMPIYLVEPTVFTRVLKNVELPE